ncbi:MAG: PaaI family thioesterase [Marinobacter sp.]|nr:PaaI family thioesterase [Marinobacter sp.]
MNRLDAVRNLPLHRYLGVSRLTSEDGCGTLTFEVGESTANPAGVLHGGVIYTLCDVCAYAGLLSVLAPDQEAVTHDIHVSVMRSAQHGDTVVIESRPVRLGRRIGFFEVTATVGDTVIATARVTKSILV